MIPEDDRVIETCRSVLNVLMLILDFLNNIYVCECGGVCNKIIPEECILWKQLEITNEPCNSSNAYC